MRILTLVFAMCVLLSNTSFEQAGELDSSFGDNGTILSQPGLESQGRSVAIQSDGKILISGYTNDSVAGHHNYNYLLVRYNYDGSYDKEFGQKGKVITDLGSSVDYGGKVLLQPDGKILVTGVTVNDLGFDIVTLRYKNTGVIDSSFGINGKATTNFGEQNYGPVIAIQPSGKILLSGLLDNGTVRNDFLMRYKENGQIDSSFGINGKVMINVSDFPFLHTIKVDSNGKIILIYQADVNGNSQFGIARYKQNGFIDSSFGVNGKVTTVFDEASTPAGIAFQKDGKIIVTGLKGRQSIAMARYKHNGEPDSSFGVNGLISYKFKSLPITARVALQSDEKIVVLTNIYDAFAITRYKHNGTIDSSFGINGTTLISFQFESEPEDLAIEKDDKIVAVGNSYDWNEVTSIAVARFIGKNKVTRNRQGNNSLPLRKQNNTISTILISPNPVKDVLHIEGLSSSTKRISVFDAKEKLLQQVTTSNNNYSFNTKQFSAGMYFIRITEGDKIITLKFVKE